MSPTPPILNPSQTVERIREIIVGRHLERLEGRVAKLELSPIPAENNANAPIFEDRLLVAEAKVEALQDYVQRMEASREDSLQLAAMHRQEAQRLAAQIQESARAKAESAALPAVENLEKKLGLWLTDWQRSLHVRLEDRDQKLISKLQKDLAALRENVEQRLSQVESGAKSDLDRRMDKIAEAARKLAESAASISTADRVES